LSPGFFQERNYADFFILFYRCLESFYVNKHSAANAITFPFTMSLEEKQACFGVSVTNKVFGVLNGFEVLFFAVFRARNSSQPKDAGDRDDADDRREKSI